MAKDNENDVAGIRPMPLDPGSHCLAHHHQAATWMETPVTTAVLGDLKLLAVANGRERPDASCIVDVELLPELPPEHPQYTRRMESRSRTVAQNDANARKRYTIQMDSWTALYAKLKASTARTAPLLSRRLQETCDLSKTHGITDGYFDGPRAWRIIKQELEASLSFLRTLLPVSCANPAESSISSSNTSLFVVTLPYHTLSWSSCIGLSSLAISSLSSSSSIATAGIVTATVACAFFVAAATCSLMWWFGLQGVCRWGMERLFTHALAPGTPPPAVATAAAARMASWLGIRLTQCSQKNFRSAGYIHTPIYYGDQASLLKPAP